MSISKNYSDELRNTSSLTSPPCGLAGKRPNIVARATPFDALVRFANIAHLRAKLSNAYANTKRSQRASFSPRNVSCNATTVLTSNF